MLDAINIDNVRVFVNLFVFCVRDFLFLAIFFQVDLTKVDEI